MQVQLPKQQVLELAINAMAFHQSLWDCYLTDFITHKLKSHHATQGDIAQQIFCAYFEHLNSYKMQQRLVQLHCQASIDHLFLAQMAAILRSLGEGVRKKE